MPVCAYSADASIANFVVNERPTVRISFGVKDAFTQDIEDAIKSGMPTVFTYSIIFKRVRGAWFNEEVGSYVFTHAVLYDILRDEYAVTMDEASVKTVKTADYAEMMRLMTTVDGFTVVSASPMQKAATYEVRIMAKLHSTELPGVLGGVTFFVKLWNFETDWFVYRFIY